MTDKINSEPHSVPFGASDCSRNITDDIINGLKHIADDHPCCRMSLKEAMSQLESLQNQNAAMRGLIASAHKWGANGTKGYDSGSAMAFGIGAGMILANAQDEKSPPNKTP